MSKREETLLHNLTIVGYEAEITVDEMETWASLINKLWTSSAVSLEQSDLSKLLSCARRALRGYLTTTKQLQDIRERLKERSWAVHNYASYISPSGTHGSGTWENCQAEPCVSDQALTEGRD